WRDHPRPALEEFLGDSVGPTRAVLVRELLRLELDYRCRGGEGPGAEEYAARLPDDATLIRAVVASAPTSPPPRPSPPSRPVRGDGPRGQPRLGDYQFLKKLGGGTMGDVYRARQTAVCREVALKHIKDSLVGAEGREAAMGGKLGHH